jgi:hypothetical protein
MKEASRTKSESWQEDSFAVVKSIPELNYASRFYSRQMKRLKIYPALRDNQDRTKRIETGEPVDLLDRIQDPGGGRSHILGSYGRLMFIAGEGCLFGRNLETDDERWAFVSTKEVETRDGTIFWKPTSNSTPQEFSPSNAVVYRMWMADPERSGEPEAPMRAALEIARELQLLTKAVHTTAIARMLTGILKVPAELSFGSDIAGMDEDAESNPFLRDLIEWATGIIEAAGSAEAATPFIAEGAAEFLEQLQFMETHNPETDYMEKDLRLEAIGRLAMGLDMPAELLKGLADANHWGARQIMHDAWKSHGSGIAEQFCDDLAEAYLRPALREAEFEDWKKVVIAYDDSEVVVSPDRADDAHKAYAAGALNDEGYRMYTGLAQEYAPSEEEKKIWLAVKMRESAFLEGTKYEIETPEPGPFDPGPQTDPSRNGGDPEEEPPAPGPAGVSRRESRSLAMQGAASAAIVRCRSLAGSRLRSKFHKTPEFSQFCGESNSVLAARMGQSMLEAMKADDALTLVKGGSSDFIDLCTTEWGVQPAQALAMGQVVEVFASRTLYEERAPKLPSGLKAQIESAISVSTEMVVEKNNEALKELARIYPEGMVGLAVPSGEEG